MQTLVSASQRDTELPSLQGVALAHRCLWLMRAGRVVSAGWPSSRGVQCSAWCGPCAGQRGRAQAPRGVPEALLAEETLAAQMSQVRSHLVSFFTQREAPGTAARRSLRGDVAVLRLPPSGPGLLVQVSVGLGRRARPSRVALGRTLSACDVCGRRDELRRFQERGTLTRLTVCFSREPPAGEAPAKYVQDGMRRHGAALARLLLREGGCVCVCG